MESGGVRGRLVGTEIHGFHTFHDLDLPNIIEEAKMRWLRPNEIHAILCNFKYFNIIVKPVNLPKSGTIVLFDRKMLRNFRKDGHNWKKKKDGKTVKEAHEHLKVGNEERIHVYYAHGQDNPTFVRRCYWLLDKTLEHIVLVHYRETQENRETQELQGSPATPVNSSSSSVSDPSAPWLLSEELDSGADQAYRVGVIDLLEPGDSLTVRNHELTLHDINTLEWDELLVTNDPNNSTSQKGDKVSFIDQQNQVALNGSSRDSSHLSVSNLSAEISAFGNLSEPNVRSDNINFSIRDSAGVRTMGGQVNSNVQRRDSITVGAGDSLELLVNDGLQSQDSFGRWINYILTDSPGSVDNPVRESSFSPGHDSFASTTMDHRQYVSEHIFTITDVSPSWASLTERTKILVTGFFREEYLHLAKSNLFCVCGAVCVPAEIVQVGVYRSFLSLHSPGFMNIYMSLDGHKPISQVLNFECHAPLLHDPIVSSEDKSKWEEFDVQMRLAHLLFSSSKSLSILSSKVSPNVLKEAEKFSLKTSHVSNSWAYLIKSVDENKTSFQQAKDSLFELTLKNRLKEWLLERIVEGGKAKEYDVQGQGVIHLCVILGYTWAVQLFSWSGLSLDFRDKRGWTPLHWAAYCGSEKMVAVLLFAGAKPNMVTDPTSQNPGGCTPADLASMKGFEGLAAYLSEKALVDHFKDMSIAGNASGSLQTSTTDTVNPENLSEKEVYTRESLQAVRTAADAAARIQAAFREHSLKVKTSAVQIFSPEDEARNIVAAMRIQHAFRNFETRKRMSAAAQIQYRFRAWKMRRQFINMRRQAIKIQAAFRGYQMRRQYRKIIWSVGVLEKVILRWRLRRKGFRGLNVDPVQEVSDPKQESDAEEEFFRASQKQAVERIDRSYGQVKVMFSSMKAQEEYHRMKLAHDEARLEFQGLCDPDTEMGK